MLIQLLTKKYPGMRLWLSQRLTAIVMAIYIVLLIALLVLKQPANFVSWHDLFAPIWFRLATLLFFISLCMHAWLGVADVLKDYIFNKSLRAYLQVVVDIALLGYLVWFILILWNV
jgi:succinate dehydrogenase / fumarate reductase, membrane anchor subunit